MSEAEGPILWEEVSVGNDPVIREAIAACERVGLGKRFLTMLAHKEKFRYRVLEIYDAQVPLSNEEAVTIKQWIRKLRRTDHAFDEEHSYDAGNPASTHREMLKSLQKGLFKSLFENGYSNFFAQEACELIELVFLMAYLHSSLYWCCQLVHNAREWTTNPASGVKITFFGLRIKNIHVSLGEFLTHKMFIEDASVQAICAIEKLMQSLRTDDEIRMFFEDVGGEILRRSRIALHGALDKLEEFVNSNTEA